MRSVAPLLLAFLAISGTAAAAVPVENFDPAAPSSPPPAQVVGGLFERLASLHADASDRIHATLAASVDSGTLTFRVAGFVADLAVGPLRLVSSLARNALPDPAREHWAGVEPAVHSAHGVAASLDETLANEYTTAAARARDASASGTAAAGQAIARANQASEDAMACAKISANGACPV